ncbi:MAG TPA: UDP-N-acetylmuramate dehydrogenase [Vicinamibacterales bacterium]|nr:UDP-N-acetylmuramate dehydrogenase [Vicinamibacterales bacterium]
MTAHPFDVRLETLVPAARVRRDAPLGPLTTFRIGGPADWLITVESEAELVGVMRAAGEYGVPVTVLGGGSNVVIADAGIRGAVVRPRLVEIRQTGADRVRAGAGVTINGLVRWTVGRGLAGLEAWAGTPGTVGGAICGNAHWGGRNIGDLTIALALVAQGGPRTVVSRDQMQFAYDASRLQTSGETLVWAEFDVQPGEVAALRQTARASLAYRKATQPLSRPSAGCIFRNPDPAVEPVPADVPASAGALIDRAGLKGSRLGGASISTAHANFIVNDGSATADDVRALVERTRAAVRDRFGVDLREEVVFLGTF